MDLLSGRVAVVTGGARGIGLAVARRYAAEGATVVIADVDAAACDAAAAELGPRVGAATVDVTDEASVEALATTVEERHGRADVVVANAGVLVLGHLLELTPAQWRRAIDVNLTGAFLTCRAFARRLVDQPGGGRLILTSSLFGVRGGVENSAYSASKFGMLGLMESAAAELAPHGVLVNAVCPGQIATPMLDQLFADRSALTGNPATTERDRLVARIPAGRLGTTDEVADVFVYLASDLSRYVTGQAHVVDGGWTVG